MKSITPVLMISKAQHLGFVSVCVLLLGGGVYAKVAVDRIGDQQDEFCKRFEHPSQVYLWSEIHRQKTNAIVLTPETKTAPVRPVTSAIEGPALP